MQNIDQSNYSRENSKRKINTPSLVFYKSSSKSPIGRLRSYQSPSHSLSISKSNINYQCHNHPTKKATFVLPSGEVHFCQKCAISLASQGHIVTKISNDKHNIQISSIKTRTNSSKNIQPYSRSLQVTKFILQLKHLKNNISQNKQYIKQKLIQSQQFYGQQIEQINQYFQLVIKSLQLQKNKCYNYILNDRKKAEIPVRNISNQLTMVDGQIDKILRDIQDNLQTVYSIDQKMYQMVISQYVSQKTEFEKEIESFSMSNIQMNKIQFAGVPDQIFNLSDLIIPNNICSQLQRAAYKLVDSIHTDDINDVQAMSPRDYIQLQGNNQFIRNAMSSDKLKLSFEAQKMKNFDHLIDNESFNRYIQSNQNSMINK